MTFAQTLEFLRARQGLSKKDSLAHVLACLERLGNPHKKIRAVHVTGTNGKGSVCALIAGALAESGFKTGLFTSPHLCRITERIKINGVEISDEDFTRHIASAAAHETEPLSFFELLTVACFLYFAERGVDAVVLEVGIGGRFDTTNVIENPLVCAITSVGLDHVQILGGTLERIAAEKGGIIKPSCDCVCGALELGPRRVLRDIAAAQHAQIRFVEEGEIFRANGYDWETGALTLSGPGGGLWPLGLIGSRQAQNAAVAFACIEVLSKRGLVCEPAAIRRAFSQVRWPARFQIIARANGGRVILDGAHNPQAARAFADTFAMSPFSVQKNVFILGVMADKDYKAVIDCLAPFLKAVICVAAPSPRALAPEKLAALVAARCPAARVSAENDFEQAFSKAALISDNIIITGSFYLAGATLSLLAREPAEKGRVSQYAS